MKLLIVIVNYKRADLTVECLHSLAPQIPHPSTSSNEIQVAICENDSGPTQATTIQNAIDQHNYSSWATLTLAPTNLGFTGGNNLLINPALNSPSPPDYFFLLNNDTIVQPNALNLLLNYMDQNPTVGILGPKLIDPPTNQDDPNSKGFNSGGSGGSGVQHSAFRFHTPLSELDRGLKLGPISKLLKNYLVCPPIIPTSPTPTDWVSGAALLIRTKTLQDTGPLDTDYFTYFEDTDLCHTASKNNWPTHYLPAATIIHLGGQSTNIDNKHSTTTPRYPAFWFQARRRYLLKTLSPFRALLADTLFITGYTLYKIRSFITRKKTNDTPHFLRDSITHSIPLTGFKLKPVLPPPPILPTPSQSSR